MVLVPYPDRVELSRIIESATAHVVPAHRSVPPAVAGPPDSANFGAVNWQAECGSTGIGRQPLAAPMTRSRSTSPMPCTTATTRSSSASMSPLDGCGIPLGKQRRNPSDIFYTGSSGIWQTVWLEPTSAAHIVRARTTPDVPGGKLDLVVTAGRCRLLSSVRVVV